jgi:hypothetical protein
MEVMNMEFDGLTEKLDAIKAFYRDNAPLAADNWNDVKEVLVKNANALIAKYPDDSFMHDMVISAYRELKRLIVWNMKARAGKC